MGVSPLDPNSNKCENVDTFSALTFDSLILKTLLILWGFKYAFLCPSCNCFVAFYASVDHFVAEQQHQGGIVDFSTKLNENDFFLCKINFGTHIYKRTPKNHEKLTIRVLVKPYPRPGSRNTVLF